jgi:glycopeptide antibiotics resistance protein
VLSANILVIVAVVVMIGVIVKGRAHGARWPAIIARCALTLAVAWILALTIFRIPVEARPWKSDRVLSNISVVPFRTIGGHLAHGLERWEARQVLGNIALVAPLGFLLPFASRTFRHTWPALLVATGLSMLIEAVQAPLPSHSSDVDDVILNTAGAAVGFLAFSVIRWMWRRRLAAEEQTFLGAARSSAG